MPDLLVFQQDRPYPNENCVANEAWRAYQTWVEGYSNDEDETKKMQMLVY